MTDWVETIDALLPQTQCTRCGYDGCRPYAEAIATGTPHNQCPPGGQALIEKLSQLLDRPELPLNPENGSEQPPLVAVIAEDQCIGCTKCIQACPVDAILGAGKKMHTVLTDECSGCELCITPCPVDCISMVPATPESTQLLSWSDTEARAQHYRKRYENRGVRLAKRQQADRRQYQDNKVTQVADHNAQRADKLAYIRAAMQRRNQHKGTPDESTHS